MILFAEFLPFKIIHNMNMNTVYYCHDWTNKKNVMQCTTGCFSCCRYHKQRRVVSIYFLIFINTKLPSFPSVNGARWSSTTNNHTHSRITPLNFISCYTHFGNINTYIIALSSDSQLNNPHKFPYNTKWLDLPFSFEHKKKTDSKGS